MGVEKLEKKARFIMYNRSCCNEGLKYIVKLSVVSCLFYASFLAHPCSGSFVRALDLGPKGC